MEEALEHLMQELNLALLLAVIAGSILALCKGADWLVGEAVVLSERSGVPKVVIGATIVSLGTTTPEAAVSVLAAVQGDPGLALGNAVGSVICDTGLVLGLACLIAPLRLHRRIVNRQGWIQVGAGCLLVIACWPIPGVGDAFDAGGRLPQTVGFAFVALLGVYLWVTVRWAKRDREPVHLEDLEVDIRKPTFIVVGKLVAGLAIVVVSSWILIPAVEELAERIGVPSSILAATLVAFGTSLPELVTAVTAAWRGHGDLAVGNVVGADILNVFFVAGLSAAVTPGGLAAGPHFFRVLFPGMLLILFVFRVGIFFSGEHMRRPFGVVLLVIYAVVQCCGYLVKPPAG